MVLSFGAGAKREAVLLALATGVSVAAYSFFAGLGVRAAGTVLGFQACLEIVTGAGTVGYVAAVRRADLATFARKHGAIGRAGRRDLGDRLPGLSRGGPAACRSAR